MANDFKTGFGKKMAISSNDNSFGGIVLEIEKGKTTDMVFHIHSKKLLYVLTGKLNITVLSDGKIAKVDAAAGASFAIREGLVYQLEAVEKSVVVEFSNCWDLKDVHCVSRGSALSAVNEDSAVQPDNKQVVEEPKVEAPREPVVSSKKSKKKKK